MTEVSLTVQASREKVFEVLADGWSFAGWVVGASHIRDVDPGWPAAGSKLHHSVGPWPLVVKDVTVVREVQPPRLIELDARLWPVGAATVRLELDDIAPNVTRVRMVEQVVRGPAKIVPSAAQALLLVPRNRESLRRLADQAVGRGERPASRGTAMDAAIETTGQRPVSLQDEAAQQDQLQAQRQQMPRRRR